MTKQPTFFGLRRIFAQLDYRYIYILGNTRYLFRYKIGIARSIESRLRGINSTVNGSTYEIFAARIFYARTVEQFFHILYSPLNARMKGSGRTEWFWMFLPVSPMILLAIIWVVQWLLIPLGLIFLANVWQHL